MSTLFYMENRGSMTQFDPITPQQVEAVANGLLTYDALAAVLAKHGLTIKRVIHDPNRHFENTCYADYDRGLYGFLYSFEQIAKEGTCPEIQVLCRPEAINNKYLAAQDWEHYYFMSVPLSMLIYDFSRRIYDLPTEDLFQIWYRIYKRIDYSNGMWRPEILEYVFSHAPKTEIPPLNANGMVTIYRGAGTLSSPPDQAVSWSTHPGNALWFANHFGRGTDVFKAEVAPQNIVKYDPGFQNENEVIIRPGTGMNCRREDMFSATQDTMTQLFLPAYIDFVSYGRQVADLGYKPEDGFGIHGINHILRVLLLSLITFYNGEMDLSESDKRIIIYFSLLHDIGRSNEDADKTHGSASLRAIDSKKLSIKSLDLTKKELQIARLIIEYHCRDDEEGLMAICRRVGFSQKDKQRARKLYNVCKDMDGLDRVRFNGLDYRMLRTPFARKLPLIAGCLLHEDMTKAVEYGVI